MITRNSVLAAGYTAINRLAVPLAGLALVIVIGRFSSRLLGEYALVMSFYIVMQTVPLLGLTPFVMREVARSPERAGRWFGTIAVLAIGGCMLVDAVVLPLLSVLGYGREVRDAISLVGVSIVPGILAYLAEIILISLDHARPVAVVALAENLFRLIVCGFVLWNRGGVVDLTLVLLVGRLAALAAYGVVLRRQPGFKMGFDRGILSQTRAVLPAFLVSGVLTVVISRLDFIVLSVVSTIEEVGRYSIAYRTFEIATVASAAGLTGLFPILAQRFHAGSAEFLAQILRLLPALLTLTFPVVLLGYALAPLYVRLLFPKQFPGPVALSGSFCLLALVGWADQFLAASLNAADRQRLDAAAFSAGSLTFVAVLLITAPRWGGQGAFAAMLCGLGVQSSLRFLALRHAGASPPGGALWPPLLIGAVMAITIVVSRSAYPLAAIALSIAAAAVLIPRALDKLGLRGSSAALPRSRSTADWMRR